MDTMNPLFEDLIVEQATRHLEKIPHFEGIAIDRLDYSEFFNLDADDGLSWIPNVAATATATTSRAWGPARSMRLAYRHTLNRLHTLLHPRTGDSSGGGGGGSGDGKMILMNCNSLCRIGERA